MTIDLQITGEAADEIKQLAQASGESVVSYIGEAVAAKRWVDDNVSAGRLYISEPDGHLREVEPAKDISYVI